MIKMFEYQIWRLLVFDFFIPFFTSSAIESMYLVDSSSLRPVLWTRDNNSATSVSAVTIPKRTQANPSLPSPEYTDQLVQNTSRKNMYLLVGLPNENAASIERSCCTMRTFSRFKSCFA